MRTIQEAHEDALLESVRLRAAITGPIRDHLLEAGSIIHSNSDHPERIDFSAALSEIDAAIAACRSALQ